MVHLHALILERGSTKFNHMHIRGPTSGLHTHCVRTPVLPPTPPRSCGLLSPLKPSCIHLHSLPPSPPPPHPHHHPLCEGQHGGQVLLLVVALKCSYTPGTGQCSSMGPSVPINSMDCVCNITGYPCNWQFQTCRNWSSLEMYLSVLLRPGHVILKRRWVGG